MTNTCSNANEELALNSALEESTPILAESLQRAEQVRRRKRRLMAGGLIMLVLGASIVVSLMLTGDKPGETKGPGETPAVVKTVEPEVTIDQFEEVVTAQALSQKGWQLWAERQYGEAAQQFVAAIKVDPESANHWNGLGWSLIHTGQHEKATDAFKQCLILDSDAQAAINGLGQIAYAKRDYEQAETWFLKAPDASAAQHTLVSVYLLTDQYEQAVDLSNQLLEALPAQTDDPSILSQRSWLTELNAAAMSGQVPDVLRQQVEPAKPAQSDIGVDGKPIRTDEVNLLVNGGFEQGTRGWIIGSNSGRMNLSLDSQEKTQGKQSLKLTKTGGTPIDIVRINADNLVPGQRVEVSASVKADQVGNTWMKFYVWDADGKILIEDLDVTLIHGQHDWRTAKKRFTLPDDTDSVAIQFWMVMGGTMWIDDVRVKVVELE